MGVPPSERQDDSPETDAWRQRGFKGIGEAEAQVMIKNEISRRLAELSNGDEGGGGFSVAGQRLKLRIWGPQSLQMIIGLGLMLAIAAMVYDANAGRHEMKELVQQQWRRMAERDQQMRYDHEKISYERREDRCILLFSPEERKGLRAMLNAGINPFSIECSWLGSPPSPPGGRPLPNSTSTP